MKYAIAFAAAAAVALLGTAAPAGTLDRVKAKGHIRCGVNEGLPGFSEKGANGEWAGIDVDICRGVAAALFRDPSKVDYIPLSAKHRFDALLQGKIDVLSRNTTWTLGRDATGLDFAAVSFYDGQSFMVRKDLNIAEVKDLDGANICVAEGTTTVTNLADYFRANNLTYTEKIYPENDKIITAYDSGVCEAYTADHSALYGHRTKLSDPDAHVILAKTISKEPLGPVVRGCAAGDDDRWLEVIRWTLFAMLEAEELGVTSANVDELRVNSKIPSIRRLLGVEGEMGKQLGLPDDWSYNIIKLVGNYAEIFERNLGSGTRLNIPRGLNALWKDGGLQYAMPILPKQ
jgi:general L-amino acid transport system substrate-binding protein